MIQGNRAASPAWMINTIMLILYIYQLRLVPISRTLISDEIFYLIAQLFIDDTDLKIDNNGNETAIEVISRAQTTLTA